MGNRAKIGAGLAVVAVAAAACLWWASGREVRQLVARNVEARGGAAAWSQVEALRFTGKMEVGQQMLVPFVLEQQRPDKSRLEFEFDGQTAVQATDGESGWKIEPYRGSTAPVAMSEAEVREAADLADPYGLLYDYRRRGHHVVVVGHDPVQGREAVELEVTLPDGAVRTVTLDAETALEIKVGATKELAGKERRVETWYSDWQETDGLLVARQQESRAEGRSGGTR
ncbi:MAG: hypothetical protein R3F59_08635 [Myxococcota bacterium]